MSDELTIEKLRIVEQLQDNTKALSEITKSLIAQGEQLKSLVAGQLVTHVALLGDGSDNRVGLIIDVDRLKQQAKDGSFHRKAIYTGLVASVLEQIRVHFWK